MRGVRLATLVFCIAALAVATSGGAPAAAGTPLPRLLTCGGARSLQPRTYVIACADGNSELLALRWKSWTHTQASASGTYSFNNCTPNCADGKWSSDPAVITLSRPVESAHLGVLFKVLTVRYTVTTHGHARATTTSDVLPTTALPKHVSRG